MYNLSKKKSYLNSVLTYYRRERIRNKIFTQWMEKVTMSIDTQVKEKQVVLQYKDKCMQMVLQTLKMN